MYFYQTYSTTIVNKLSISKIEYYVFKLTNKERKKQNRTQLTRIRLIDKIARRHSKDMSKQNYFDHITRSTGDTPTERAQKAGLNMALGENIAQIWRHTSITITKNNTTKYHGFEDEKSIASSLVKMWMNSPGHRANILSNSYNQIGVGVWINYKNGKVFATQNFAYRAPKHKKIIGFIYTGIIISFIIFMFFILIRLL